MTQDEQIKSIALALAAADEKKCEYFRSSPPLLPSRDGVRAIVDGCLGVLFPDYFSGRGDSEDRLESLLLLLKRELTASYALFDKAPVVDTETLAYELLGCLPRIKELLNKDVIAIYEGDPAATSPEEVVLSYPGFYAIAIYRVAHEFYLRGVPYVSRLMTEYAHERTGIDIHAGATVGEYFFIDHGTGIVIGETTTIGDRVKLYQGVTLGAKSFELDEDGNPVKGIKRHPDIGNGVVIYANATILGGKTVIGDGATIGGNVWITRSVAPGETVYYQK